MSIVQLYLYFTIAHLMGDFLFQTSKIVKLKNKSFWGVVYHVVLISLAMNIVLFPYIKELWSFILINSFFHFTLDKTKIYIEHKQKESKVLINFFLDQFLHMVFLL